MLIDLLHSDGYVSFNIRTAQIFGLTTAVYCSELFNIYKKADDKNKLIEGDFIKVDRKYIFMRTTISIEEQLRIDDKLTKVGIIIKHEDNSDVLKLDFNLYVSIIANEDVELMDDFAERFELGKFSKRHKKETKKQIIIKNLQDSIECSDYELLTALRNWVDAIYANPKGNYLSKTSIKLFQDTLNEYTKGDLDLALRLVEIATIQGYRDCSWAINVYEKDLKNKKELQNKQPRITEQKRATKETLGDEVY